MRKHESGPIDVCIAGGGLAGLSLAIQLRQGDPDLGVVVVDKRSLPISHADHKIGESCIEIAGRYFRDTLGLGDALRSDHIVKRGFRVYTTAGENDDIAARYEIGTNIALPMETYSIDRSQFEDTLCRRARALGVQIRSGSTVSSIDLDPELHRVHIRSEDGEEIIRARWVVDSSGRSGLLRRKLALTEVTDHPIVSSWFRLDDCIDVQDWSDDPEWAGRVAKGFRREAVNHLFGTGYWIWIIPLRSGATSIGIVANEEILPFTSFNRLDRLLDWLDDHEPKLAEEVRKRAHAIRAFGAMRNVSYRARQFFAPERWALTGEAAAFNDPLYSTGSDLISTANTMITRLVTLDRAGQPIADACGFMNAVFAQVFEVLIGLFRGQYELFGNGRVYTAKAGWDFTVYMCIPVSLSCCFGNRLYDPSFMQGFGPHLARGAALAQRMQDFFRAWDLRDRSPIAPGNSDFSSLETVMRLQHSHEKELDAEAFRALMLDNLAILEETALEIFDRVVKRLGIAPERAATNPYAISLEPEHWEKDGLFAGPPASAPRPCVRRDVDRFWSAESPVRRRA